MISGFTFTTKGKNFICIMISGRMFPLFTILCQMNILQILLSKKSLKWEMKTAMKKHTTTLVNYITIFDSWYVDDYHTYWNVYTDFSYLYLFLISDCLRNSFRKEVKNQNITCTLPWILSMSGNISGNTSNVATCQIKREFDRVSSIGHEFSKQLAKYNNSRCTGW